MQFLDCKHSRFSYLISILIDTMHDMEVNPYIATRWIAFAGLDLTMGITILRVNVVHFWISFSTYHVWSCKSHCIFSCTKILGRPWIFLKVAFYDAKSNLIYLGMTVRPQCILPYRCSCGSRQCWYNSQSRHKYDFYWGTHRYLVEQMI